MEHISADELHNRTLNLDSADLILDVRSPKEFNDGHIEGAQNTPHEEVVKEAVAVIPMLTDAVIHRQFFPSALVGVAMVKPAVYQTQRQDGAVPNAPTGQVTVKGADILQRPAHQDPARNILVHIGSDSRFHGN